MKPWIKIILLFIFLNCSVNGYECDLCVDMLINCTSSYVAQASTSMSCVCLSQTVSCLQNKMCESKGIQNIYVQLCQSTQSSLDVNIIDHHVNGDFLSTFLESTEIINIIISFINLIFVMYLVYVFRIRRRPVSYF